MATVKLHSDGKVVLRDGIVQCECCDIQLNEFVFGEPGDCDCETVLCYNAETNPSPSTRQMGEAVLVNDRELVGTDRFKVVRWYPDGVVQGGGFYGAAFIQRPELDEDLFFNGPWINRVSSPRIMQLTGSCGGDIALTVKRWPTTTIEIPENIEDIEDLILEQGTRPCGICDVPRNGPRSNINQVFILYPEMMCYVEAVSFLDCTPWFNLRLRNVAPYIPAPP